MNLPLVLDSCVLFPMPLCDTLLRVAEAKLYNLYYSQEILDGATRNLVRTGRMTQLKAAYFQGMIKTYFPNSRVEVPDELIGIMTNHPGDRHVLAAAVVAQAKWIVTYNLKHFPLEALAIWGIEAWHPDDFLVYLNSRFPEAILQIIRQQSEALKNPPITVVELLNKLEQDNQVPKFTDSIRLSKGFISE